jgi:predicted secreted Zn-dependent protease
MNIIKRWSERRNNKKEFKKIFDGILEAVKKMVLFEPNTSEKHREIEKITANMLIANGCDNVEVYMEAIGERSEKAIMGIHLSYHGIKREIHLLFTPLEVKNI